MSRISPRDAVTYTTAWLMSTGSDLTGARGSVVSVHTMGSGRIIADVRWPWGVVPVAAANLRRVGACRSPGEAVVEWMRQLADAGRAHGDDLRELVTEAAPALSDSADTRLGQLVEAGEILPAEWLPTPSQLAFWSMQYPKIYRQHPEKFLHSGQPAGLRTGFVYVPTG